MFNVGDIVLVRGQKTRFFEVINIDGNEFWISDGYVQITKDENDVIELICKAENRQDKKVPLLKYWKS